MLRHVLEEHLGLSGLNLDLDFSSFLLPPAAINPSSQTTEDRGSTAQSQLKANDLGWGTQTMTPPLQTPSASGGTKRKMAHRQGLDHTQKDKIHDSHKHSQKLVHGRQPSLGQTQAQARHIKTNHFHHHCRTHSHSHPHPVLPTPSPSTRTSSPRASSVFSDSERGLHDSATSGITNPTSTSHCNTDLADKPLVCLWPGCTHLEPFSDPGTLMDHLSEEHVGKNKTTYVCLWGACGGIGKDGEGVAKEEDSDGEEDSHEGDERQRPSKASKRSTHSEHGTTSTSSENAPCHPIGREFKSRQKVLRHLQTHTGHKPFVCKVCDQAFSEAAPLQAHMRRHAQESELICCMFATGAVGIRSGGVVG